MSIERDGSNDIDLTSEVTFICIAVLGGLAALAFSVKLAMFFCMGLLFLAAGWFALAPELEKRKHH